MKGVLKTAWKWVILEVCQVGHSPGRDSSHSTNSAKEILAVWALGLTSWLSVRVGLSKALLTSADVYLDLQDT